MGVVVGGGAGREMLALVAVVLFVSAAAILRGLVVREEALVNPAA